MNNIRQIQELNKRELEAGISPEASWHADYRDTAYVYIGGLPFELSEGDILTIFSQFGEPTYINLIRDKETGKSKGFAFLKYEDQRSTDLAVDNLGGAVVMGRTLRVDHTRYKKRDDEEPDEGIDLSADNRIEQSKDEVEEHEDDRPMLKEERDLQLLIRDHDEDDPMKSFLIEEKKAEIANALALLKDAKSGDVEHKSKRRHHHSHRSREEDYSKDRKHGSGRRRDDSPRESSHRGDRRQPERHRSERRERRSRTPERSRHHKKQDDAAERSREAMPERSRR